MADVVIHQMFRAEDGILPCCGLHRYEVKQTDRVALDISTTPNCTGKKRYEPTTTRAQRRALHQVINQQRKARRGK